MPSAAVVMLALAALSAFVTAGGGFMVVEGCCRSRVPLVLRQP